MGEIVLAAKIAHVPSILISERRGPLNGKRDDGHPALARGRPRARAQRGADTFLIFDTHWISNFGCHMNAKARHRGVYTSHEAPHMIQNMDYDYPGDPELGDAIAVEAKRTGSTCSRTRSRRCALEYGTIVPMHYMNEGGWARVLSVAAPIFATVEENRKFGAACARAILASGRKVAVLASGSLSHKLVSNDQVGDNQWEQVGSEFNRQMDLRVLDLWKERRYARIRADAPGLLDQVQRRGADGGHAHDLRPARLGQICRRDGNALPLFPVLGQRAGRSCEYHLR